MNGIATSQQQQQAQQPLSPNHQQPTSPSQMLAGLGMVPPSQMDPYYYMNQQSVYPRQPVSSLSLFFSLCADKKNY